MDQILNIRKLLFVDGASTMDLCRRQSRTNRDSATNIHTSLGFGGGGGGQRVVSPSILFNVLWVTILSLARLCLDSVLIFFEDDISPFSRRSPNILGTEPSWTCQFERKICILPMNI
jgi:hypothetical protein